MQYAIFRISQVERSTWTEQQPAIVGTPDDGWKNQFWMGRNIAKAHARSMAANERDERVKRYEVRDQDQSVVETFHVR